MDGAPCARAGVSRHSEPRPPLVSCAPWTEAFRSSSRARRRRGRRRRQNDLGPSAVPIALLSVTAAAWLLAVLRGRRIYLSLSRSSRSLRALAQTRCQPCLSRFLTLAANVCDESSARLLCLSRCCLSVTAAAWLRGRRLSISLSLEPLASRASADPLPTLFLSFSDTSGQCL